MFDTKLYVLPEEKHMLVKVSLFGTPSKLIWIPKDMLNWLHVPSNCWWQHTGSPKVVPGDVHWCLYDIS
jgi:hypothetical protein